jgi:Prokaryotic lipoprotein-attachment site
MGKAGLPRPPDNTTLGPGLWYPLPMRTPRDTTPRPAPIRLTHGGPARCFIVGLLLLSLAACGQKGGLYREKKPESRLTSDAALLLP